MPTMTPDQAEALARDDPDALNAAIAVAMDREGEWWCPVCGFIPGRQVGHDEHCSTCGCQLPCKAPDYITDAALQREMLLWMLEDGYHIDLRLSVGPGSASCALSFFHGLQLGAGPTLNYAIGAALAMALAAAGLLEEAEDRCDDCGHVGSACLCARPDDHDPYG